MPRARAAVSVITMTQQLIEPGLDLRFPTEPPSEPDEIYVHDSTANPAPLGLMGFGLTTLLLNIHNAGYIELSSMILAMGIFYGGLAQVIAGMIDFRKGNEFGATAFTSYGLFWLSLVALVVFPDHAFGDEPSSRAMGWYLFSWGVFTAIMFVGSLRTTRALQLVFLALATLFFLLAIADWTGNDTVLKIAGWEGIVTALVAIYTATAQIWNDVYGRVVLPLGPVAKR
jgi:succinate-acetate transporter protein